MNPAFDTPALWKVGVSTDVTLWFDLSHSHVTVPPTVTHASAGENWLFCTLPSPRVKAVGAGPGVVKGVAVVAG